MVTIDIGWTSWSAAEIGDQSWTSPLVTPGFCFDELVASWNAMTPAGAWVEVLAQVVSDEGESGWLVLARWSSDESYASTTVAGQHDPLAVVDEDTIRARSGLLTGYRLRVTLHGEATISLLGAMVSAGARGAACVDDKPPAVVVRGVPAYSQQLHRDRYPEWDGGGQSWCSATSTAMVTDFWGVGPGPEETAWVAYETPDPQVPATTRAVYDHGADAAGTWPFNTAYAATRGLVGFVTRLRSLSEAVLFLERGIPLVLSIAHGEGELRGAGYTTNGHLVVLVGIDEAGDPLVHDPASHGIADDAQVLVTYDRGELERAWARSGRIVYVIHPAGVALPKSPAQPNW